MTSILFTFLVLQWILGFCEIYAEARSRKENKKRHFDFREIVSNLSASNLTLFRWLLVVPVIIFYNYLFLFSTPWHFSWPKTSVINWWIAFIIADLIFYLFHILSHRWNLLWGSHLVHHQPEYWNLSIGGRDSIFGRSILCFMGLPLALTGLPPMIYYSAAFTGIAYMGWTHTRLVGRLGILEYFLSTPYHHKIHHYKDTSRLGGTKNFGGVFIIWDKIFGTFWEENGAEKRDYEFGIRGMPAIYSPIRSQTFFYQHLFRVFFKIPVRDRLKLLFSHYLPEPIPMHAGEFRNPARPHSYGDWFFCFLLLILIYQGSSVLALLPPFGPTEAQFDAALLIKLFVACGATFLGIFQISRILQSGGGVTSRTRLSLLLSVTAVSVAFAFLSQEMADDHKKSILDFVLGSRAFFALGALIALR